MCVATYEAMLLIECRSKAARAVLSYLAWTKNHLTALCFPKPQTIAARTQLSQSGVYAALAELREDGLIENTTVQIDNRELAGFKIIHPERGEITNDVPFFVINLHGELSAPRPIPATGKTIPATGIAYNKIKPEYEPETKRETADKMPPPPPQRRTTVPDNLSPEMLQHGLSKGLSDEEVRSEHERFVNWFRARGIRFVDWTASWANWVFRGLDHRRDLANRAKRQLAARGSFADATRAAAAKLRDEEVRGRPGRADFGDLRDLELLAGPPAAGSGHRW